MGRMSRAVGNLPERPQPPSLAEQDQDIESAEDSDCVFQFGKECLADYEMGLQSSPAGDNNSNSSHSSLEMSSASSSGFNHDQIKESYADVLRLLSLYGCLKEVPSDLEEKYRGLKDANEELKTSVSQLRVLSHDFGLQLSSENIDEDSKRSLSKSKVKDKSKRKK